MTASTRPSRYHGPFTRPGEGHLAAEGHSHLRTSISPLCPRTIRVEAQTSVNRRPSLMVTRPPSHDC